MTDHPDHPVRQRPEFVMLRQLSREVPSMAWGVKLHLVKNGRPTIAQRPNFVKWTYGPTAEDALDAALAHLVTLALES